MNIKVFALVGSALVFTLTLPAWPDQTVFPSPALQRVKAAPKKYSEAADVVTEWAEAVDPCDPEEICVEGVLYNQGRTTANNVRLFVEIGASKHTKPRTSFHKGLDQPVMAPGDRQDFSFTIPRRIPYKDKGEKKEIEVGKYNFRVTPVWTGKELSSKPATSRKK